MRDYTKELLALLALTCLVIFFISSYKLHENITEGPRVKGIIEPITEPIAETNPYTHKL